MMISRTIILSVLLMLSALSFGQDYAAMCKGISGKWGFVNTSGEEFVKTRHTLCRPFNSGMAKIGTIYFINSEGEKLHSKVPISEAGNYSDGLLAIKTKGKWGFLNTSGDLVVPAVYNGVTSFREGKGAGYNNEGFFVLDKNGGAVKIKTVNKKKLEKGKIVGIRPFKGGVARLEVDLIPGPNDELRFGFINPQGEIVVKPVYIQTGEFKDGLCWVRTKENLFGFIDVTGEEVVEPKYIKVGNFSGGYAWVRDAAGKIGFVNKAGEIVIENQFSTVRDVDPTSGMTLVKKNKVWKYMNIDGTYLELDGITTYKRFSEGAALVLKNKLWGYIDQNGKWLIEPKYRGGTYFKNGYARVKIKGKWGVINKKGEIIVEPIYKNIKEFLPIK